MSDRDGQPANVNKAGTAFAGPPDFGVGECPAAESLREDALRISSEIIDSITGNAERKEAAAARIDKLIDYAFELGDLHAHQHFFTTHQHTVGKRFEQPVDARIGVNLPAWMQMQFSALTGHYERMVREIRSDKAALTNQLRQDVPTTEHYLVSVLERQLQKITTAEFDLRHKQLEPRAGEISGKVLALYPPTGAQVPATVDAGSIKRFGSLPHSSMQPGVQQ